MYGYDNNENEIVYMSKRELHALVANAVKEGVLAALKESGKGLYPDSERPDRLGFEEPKLNPDKDKGATNNARAYLVSIREKADSVALLGRYGSLAVIKEMTALCTEEEVRYILTHLESEYTPKRPIAWRDNISNLKAVWAER